VPAIRQAAIMFTYNLTLSFISCFLILSANHAFISPISVAIYFCCVLLQVQCSTASASTSISHRPFLATMATMNNIQPFFCTSKYFDI